MSSFKKDITATAPSLLAGEKFNTGPYDVSHVTWANAPDPNAVQFKAVSGSGMVFDGVSKNSAWFNQLTLNTYYELARFEVNVKSTANIYREQLVVKFRPTTVSTSPAGGLWVMGDLHMYAYVWPTPDPTSVVQNSISVNDWGFTLGGARFDQMQSVIFSVANFVRSGTNYIFIGASAIVPKSNTGTASFDISGQALPFAKFLDIIDGTVPVVEESDEFGLASEPEGYNGGGGAGGSTAFDDHSDTIDIPTKPMSVLGLGFINVYKCDAASLTDFGAALFPEITFPTSLSDVGEVLAAVSESIWNSKLIDYVVSVHCVPSEIPLAQMGNLEAVKVGARTMTNILAKKINNEYVDFSFGSISLDEYYHGFADYMTSIQLYLPLYGFVSLKPEEIMGGHLYVDYRFNVIDGSFVAYVRSTSARSKMNQSLIGQYGGSCVVHLPVSNLSYSSMFAAMIGGGATAAVGAATGNIGGIVSGALTEAGAYANALQGGDTKKSNSYNASASFMTRRKPYIIIERPISSFSTRYNMENGLPSNIVYNIGDCEGYTVVTDPILDGIPCTEAEKTRIRSLLASGVIIKPTP